MANPQIGEWKRKYGKIYSVPHKDVEYIFREITFAEYDDVIALEKYEDSAEAEDFLVSVALLYPDPSSSDFDRIPAGVISSIANGVLEVSGFTSPKSAKQVLEEQREAVNQVRGLMKAFVLATMPAYKEEELDELTFRALAGKVALAEQIIQVNQAAFGVENEIKLDLIDPEEEEAKEAEAAMKHAAQKKPGQAGYHDPIAEKLAQALG